jgi:hypothetical protein
MIRNKQAGHNRYWKKNESKKTAGHSYGKEEKVRYIYLIMCAPKKYKFTNTMQKRDSNKEAQNFKIKGRSRKRQQSTQRIF